MDTQTALALHVPHPAASAPAAPPGIPPVDHWERLLPEAVALAWRNDPDEMSQLLGTLLAMHVHARPHRVGATLDELQLMISMELQALAGYPE